MSETKLLPCPFCGEEAELIDKIECYGHGDYEKEYYVRCSCCGASISSGVYRLDDESKKNHAIKAWNTRTIQR